MATLALSYDAIADRLRIEVASARRLVHRKKWQKGKGNDGRAVVQVPEEFFENRPDDSRADSRADSRSDSPHDSLNDSPADRPNDNLFNVLARLAEAQDELVEMSRRVGAAEGEILVLRQERAVQVEALTALVEAEKLRSYEWKGVADRFALQAEALASQQQLKRSWWSWRRAS